MPINRFYIDNPLKKETIVTLPEDEIKHFKVMRLCEGETVEIVNGKNLLAQASILTISKKQVSLKILSITQNPPAHQKLILCQSYTKASKIDWILEKGCELGAHLFIFFKTDRSERELSLKRERHLSILIASMKQCGRLDLPQIEYMSNLEPIANTHFFFGDLSEKAPFFPEYIQALKDRQNIAFINGPESGFTDKETSDFSQKLSAVGVSLNNNVLRSETAAISAMTYCQMYLK